MFGKNIWIISFILFLIISVADAGDLERLNALKNIPAARWDRIAAGQEPWPAEIFPLSYWPDEERKKLPPEYLVKLQECEKKWPEFISAQSNFFKEEYGPSAGNIYQLFLKEQAEMKKPGYSAAAPPVTAKKTLSRLIDVVYLQAKNFRAIEGASLGRVRLFSFRQDRLRIIPFDIIEFTDADRAVLPLGPEGNPGEGDGIFRNNDKLFFMAVDAGHRINIDYIRKKYPAAKKIKELELSYSKDGEIGWVYIAAFESGEPALSPLDNIEFHPEYNIYYSPFCYNQCEPRKTGGRIAPTLKVSTWASAPNIGGIPFDFHRRLRIRIRLTYILGSTEDDEDYCNVTWRAWYLGRVVNYNRAAWKVSTPLGIGAPVVFDDVVASCFSVYNYINWRTPFDPSLIMKYLDVLVGEELNDRVLKYNDTLKFYYITEKDRKGFQADGALSEEEKKRDGGYSSWHLFTGFIDTVLMRTGYDDFMMQKSRLLLDWNDNEKSVGNYDNHLIMDSFKRRNHHFYVEWNAVPFFWNENPAKYNWKNLNIVLKRIDKPLTCRIDGGEKITPGAIVHIPNIELEKNKYKY